MVKVDDFSASFRQELGYRLCNDDFMEIINELTNDKSCDGITLRKVFDRMQEQFEIRKMDGFRLSEEFTNIIKKL